MTWSIPYSIYYAVRYAFTDTLVYWYTSTNTLLYFYILHTWYWYRIQNPLYRLCHFPSPMLISWHFSGICLWAKNIGTQSATQCTNIVVYKFFNRLFRSRSYNMYVLAWKITMSLSSLSAGKGITGVRAVWYHMCHVS